MPTPVYNTGFEHGVASANGGGLADAFQGTIGTTVGIVNNNQRTGSYCLWCSPTATVDAQWRSPALASPTIVVARFYVKVTVQVGSGLNGMCADMNTPVSASHPRIRFHEDTGVVYFQAAAGSTQVGSLGPAITTGVWYRVDWFVNVSANPWNLLCRVRNESTLVESAEFGGTAAIAADTINSFRLGQATGVGPAWTAYYDDVIVSQTSVDYPIGPGEGRFISPISDGVHNPATPDCIRGGGASPALISGSNVAWQYMDDVPLPSGASPTSDRINQDTSTGAHPTHYVEMKFAQLGGRFLVNGVQGLLAYGGDSATTNKGSTVALNSAGTETAVYGTSSTPADMSETSVFYKSAQITAPAGGWNEMEVANLRMRIGYSNDVSPNPYWQALAFEIDTIPRLGSLLASAAIKRAALW